MHDLSKATVFLFEDGHLKPIDDPLPQRDGDWYEILSEYGFKYASALDRIGGEYDAVSMEVYGPADESSPYRFLCHIGNGAGGLFCVWCRDGAALHGYLKESANILLASQLSRIRGILEDSYEWLFDSSEGIFSDHVCGVLRKRESDREYYAKRQQAKKQGA